MVAVEACNICIYRGYHNVGSRDGYIHTSGVPSIALKLWLSMPDETNILNCIRLLSDCVGSTLSYTEGCQIKHSLSCWRASRTISQSCSRVCSREVDGIINLYSCQLKRIVVTTTAWRCRKEMNMTKKE
uniref:AlNc14C244G9526 protein n=1 Tax=Albugo laibachii Nc14 TaxID=890382 RepID=F0WT42_9STRA|nr:AlNc14C244G9526 [Albugo laibachii Nc14]|eukprot:CCA24529.1 AlNc14C244G9526 [Albugo laibachii Nc14]